MRKPFGISGCQGRPVTEASFRDGAPGPRLLVGAAVVAVVAILTAIAFGVGIQPEAAMLVAP